MPTDTPDWADKKARQIYYGETGETVTDRDVQRSIATALRLAASDAREAAAKVCEDAYPDDKEHREQHWYGALFAAAIRVAPKPVRAD